MNNKGSIKTNSFKHKKAIEGHILTPKNTNIRKRKPLSPPETTSETKLTEVKRLDFEDVNFSDTDSEFDTSHYLTSSSEESIIMGKLTPNEFSNMLTAALSEPRIKENIMNLQSKDIESLTEKVAEMIKNQDAMETKLKEIEEKCNKKDEVISTLQLKLDVYEQRDRKNNLIITGIEAEDNHELAKKINEELKINVVTADSIEFTDEFISRDKKKRKRIVFKNHDIKRKVYGAKRNLKGKKIYISEDLTILRSQLYFYARSAVKNGHAEAAWTIDGKVFVKHADKPKAKKVTTTVEMGDYLGIGV